MRRLDHYENILHKVLADQGGEVVAIALTALLRADLAHGHRPQGLLPGHAQAIVEAR